MNKTKTPRHLRAWSKRSKKIACPACLKTNVSLDQSTSWRDDWDRACLMIALVCRDCHTHFAANYLDDQMHTTVTMSTTSCPGAPICVPEAVAWTPTETPKASGWILIEPPKDDKK